MRPNQRELESTAIQILNSQVDGTQQWLAQISAYALSDNLYPTPLFDDRLHAIGASPWSIKFSRRLSRLVEHLHELYRQKKPKLSIFDFDETLWSGNLAELGSEVAHSIQSMENNSSQALAFSNLRSVIKRSIDFGQLIGLVTRNDRTEVERFLSRTSNFGIGLNDFAWIHADWGSKVNAIEVAAQTFGFRFHDLAFYDNDPREREQVRHAFPEIHCPELPMDPSERCLQIIDEIGWIFPERLNTFTDRIRSKSYATERQREILLSQTSPTSQLAGLAKLKPELYVKRLRLLSTDQQFNPENELLARASQLFMRTNQFHLTRVRLNAHELFARLKSDRDEVWLFGYKDQLGDDGWVGLIAWSREQKVLVDFILSCRAFNRGIECAMINFMAQRLRVATELHVAKPLQFENSRTFKFFSSLRIHSIDTQMHFAPELMPKYNSLLGTQTHL
jgi:FkbH-like protein